MDCVCAPASERAHDFAFAANLHENTYFTLCETLKTDKTWHSVSLDTLLYSK